MFTLQRLVMLSLFLQSVAFEFWRRRAPADATQSRRLTGHSLAPPGPSCGRLAAPLCAAGIITLRVSLAPTELPARLQSAIPSGA